MIPSSLFLLPLFEASRLVHKATTHKLVSIGPFITGTALAIGEADSGILKKQMCWLQNSIAALLLGERHVCLTLAAILVHELRQSVL